MLVGLAWEALGAKLRWGLIIAVIVALGGAAFWLDHGGYARAMAECERRMQVQEAANREAVRIAQERFMRTVDQIQLDNMERDNVLAEIDAAAEANPDGDALCLDADSVSRLQSIR